MLNKFYYFISRSFFLSQLHSFIKFISKILSSLFIFDYLFVWRAKVNKKSYFYKWVNTLNKYNNTWDSKNYTNNKSSFKYDFFWQNFLYSNNFKNLIFFNTSINLNNYYKEINHGSAMWVSK